MKLELRTWDSSEHFHSIPAAPLTQPTLFSSFISKGSLSYNYGICQSPERGTFQRTEDL